MGWFSHWMKVGSVWGTLRITLTEEQMKTQLVAILVTAVGLTTIFIAGAVLVGRLIFKDTQRESKWRPLQLLDLSGLSYLITTCSQWSWLENKYETLILVLGIVILAVGVRLF